MTDRVQTRRRRRRHPAARSRVAAATLSVAAFFGIGVGLAARSTAESPLGTTQGSAVRTGPDDRVVWSWSADAGGSVPPPQAPTTTTHAS